MGSANSSPQEEISAVEETEVPREDFSHKIKDGILDSISQLWPAREHADLEVMIENTRIHCHSFLLSACSKYFADLLRSRHGGVDEHTVSLTSVSEATFETILEALYTGKDVVTASNVIELWLACHELDIGFLVEVCEEFILKHMTLDNIGTFYKNALITRSEKVLQATFEVMQQNFEAFKRCEAFLEINFDSLFKLVNSHNLVAATEDTVVAAISKWVLCDPNRYLTRLNTVNRMEYLGRLFAAARLALVSGYCIAGLMDCEMVEHHREAKEARDRAFVYQLLIGNRHGQWPSSALHRNNSQSANMIVAGYRDGQMSALLATDLKTWHRWKKYSGFSSSYITLTAFNNSLYAFASSWSCCLLQSGRLSFNRQTGETFSALQNRANAQGDVSGELFVLRESEWQKVTDVSGTEHILVSHGDSIYFFHPVTKKVQKLDTPFIGIAATTLDSVPANGLIGGAVAFERSILVFCQESGNSTETTVHCLNTVTTTWSRLNDLQGGEDIVSFKDDTSTYLLQGSGAVHKIINTQSGQENFRFIGKLWDFHWQVCGCVTVGSTLYVCGDQLDVSSAGSSPENSTREQEEVIFVNDGRNSCLPGVFDSVQYISGRFDYFQPVILHKNNNFQ